MEKQVHLSRSEWRVMACLWEAPHTLMELVESLHKSADWSKSTVTTMVRRMEEKGLIRYDSQGRTKIFHPTVSREEVVAQETRSFLQKAYDGSIGLLVSAMAQRNDLTKADIQELYEILQKAEGDAK